MTADEVPPTPPDGNFLSSPELRERVLAQLAEGAQTVFQVAGALREPPEQVASALGVLAAEGRARRLGDDSPLRFEATEDPAVTAVSIVSVVVSGIVAVAAILVGVWQQRRAFAHEMRLADRAAVRGALVEAATTLQKSRTALTYARGVLEEGVDELGSPHGAKRIQACVDNWDPLAANLSKVGVGLGPEHPAAQAMNEATTSYVVACQALRRLRRPGPAIVTPEQDQERDQEISELRERFEQKSVTFREASERFILNAHAAAGAQLPAADDR